MGWWKRFWYGEEEEDDEDDEEENEFKYFCHCSYCGKLQMSDIPKEKRTSDVICAKCRLEIRRVEALEKIAASMGGEEE